MPSPVLLRAVWIPSALALAASAVVFAITPDTVPKPGPLVAYSVSDNSLSLKHPANWKPESLTSHAVLSEVKFSPVENTRFTVSADMKGALMADITRAGQTQEDNLKSMLEGSGARGGPTAGGEQGPGGVPIPGGGAEGALGSILNGSGGSGGKRKSPLEQAHDLEGAALAKKLEGLVEGETVKGQVAGVEAMVTEFTAKQSGLLGTKLLKGRRITALAQDRRLTVLYYCPEKASATLDPVFREMAASIKIGEEGQAR